MKQDLYLPHELWGDILGRLPIRSIMRCKYVCKSWRDLIEGKWGEFTTSYVPKPGLAYAHSQGTGYAVCDEAFKPLFRFHLPISHEHRAVFGSVNGLILVWDGFDKHLFNLFILNPITREYIELPPRPRRRSVFGFGVSKLSGKYKIFCCNLSRFCHVYTLGGGRGEGSWRNIAAATTLPNLKETSWYTTQGPINYLDYALFFNGSLHWLASDFGNKNDVFICCFDLETELFTRFSLPYWNTYSSIFYDAYQLCILDGHLCFCEIAINRRVDLANLLHKIWSMKSYGDPKSWVSKYAFHSPNPRYNPKTDDVITFDTIYNVNVSNGGLVFCVKDQLFIYSGNVTAYSILPCRHMFKLPNFDVYTPSFFSLKTLGIRDVQLLN